MKRMTTDDVRNDASGGPTGNVMRMLNYAYAEGGRVKLLYAGGTEEADLYDYVSQSAKQYTNCAIYPCDGQDGACLMCDCPVAILNIIAIQAAELRARLMMIEDILGEDYDLEHLRELIKAERRWIPVTERLPEGDNQVLAIVSGRWKNITFDHSYELANWNSDEGWIMDAWPEFENPDVSHWMPLPEPLGEDV